MSTPDKGKPRGRFEATVAENHRLCREHYRLRLRVAGSFPPTQPGQFVQLGCRPLAGALSAEQLSGGEFEWTPGRPMPVQQVEHRRPLALLRRPFSLAGRRDDADGGTRLEIIHREVGAGTHWLAGLEVGDRLDLIGPLGNAFRLSPGKAMGLLVGGGVGLPPMFYLAEALADAGWEAIGFVGAMCRDLLAVTFDQATAPDDAGTPLPSIVEFARCGFPTVVTTDDGSLGLRGRITEGLGRTLDMLDPTDAARAVVFTCGPERMMEAVARMAEARGIECQVCLEQAMACGMGTCQSCVVKIEEHDEPHAMTIDGRPWRYRLACTDGPVFDSRQVIWEHAAT